MLGCVDVAFLGAGLHGRAGKQAVKGGGESTGRGVRKTGRRIESEIERGGEEGEKEKENARQTQQTKKKFLDNVHDTNDQPNCYRANNCDLRVSKVRGQDRHTSCPGSRAGAPVCQRADPAVAVICYSICGAVGFIRAPVGCVCAVGLSCVACMLAMWLKVWLQDDTYMCHDTSRRTRAIPVVVDRSNNSAFYTIAFGAVGVFIILSVLGLQ